MQTTDTWPVWRRSLRWGWIRFRAEGLMQPALWLSVMVFLTLGCAGLTLWGTVAASDALDANQHVTVTLLPAVTNEQVQHLYAGFQQVPGVTRAVFVSHDQVLAQRRAAQPALAQLLDQSKLQNPFADTFDLTVARTDAFPSIRAFLVKDDWRGIVDVRSVVALSDQQTRQASLHSAVDTIFQGTVAGLVVAGLLFVFFLLSQTVSRLRSSAAERQTVSLLGGSWASANASVIAELSFVLIGGMIIALLVFVIAGFALLQVGWDMDPTLQSTWNLMQAQSQMLIMTLVITLLLIPILSSVTVLLCSHSAHRHA